MAQAIRKATQSVSPEAVEKATGKSLEHWFDLLDAFDVRQNGHKAAAKHLGEAHGVSPWWSQCLTVTYEQERGLRVPGERASGTFTINVSKTLEVSAQAAFDAWSTESGWNGWFTKGAVLDFREGG